MRIRIDHLMPLVVAAVVLSLPPARVAGQAPAAGPTGTRAWLLEKDGDLAGVGNFRSTSGCPDIASRLRPCALDKAKRFTPRRTPDGRPNFQGIWGRTVGFGSTAFEARTPEATAGAGRSMVVDPPDGRIPYQPWAREKRAEIITTYIDQTANCLPPGIPRHSVAPGPYQIIQAPGSVTFITERPGHLRHIPTDGRRPHIGPKVRLWQGDSLGRWDGDTLVIDTTNSNGMALMNVDMKDFASPQLHVVERITLIDLDQLYYEVTLEDPTVYTRPWTMAWSRTRWPGKQVELLEDACVEGNRSNILSVPNQMFLGLPEATGGARRPN